MSIYFSVRSGKQVISTSESFDRVKLSRLKYLQLQANKCLSELNLKWLVSLFTVMESLIFENTDSMFPASRGLSRRGKLERRERVSPPSFHYASS